MVTLRNYDANDAKKVISWIKNEKAFRLWSADKFQVYPLTESAFNDFYNKNNKDTLFGMIAEDDGNIVGHMFFQILEENIIKFGLIIVDDTKRGIGYGRRMLESAIEYAKEKLNAKSLVLSVFDSNISAYKCYLSLGFRENGNRTFYTFFGEKHTYFELEYKI